MQEHYQFLGVEAVAASPRMRELFEKVRIAAQSEAPILLLGEQGCGKEIVARAIHHYSSRKPHPFVDLSCAALPDEMLDAELFGHERGVFSGASAMKQGLLEMAERGSVFLDDAECLNERLQTKLSRVLETGSFFRVGGVRPARADVRLIAASSRPFQTTSAPRNELYARLSETTLTVPSLRERPEDIEALACHFLAQQNPDLRFAADAMIALYSYRWPGNVRELRNAVLRSALLAKGPLLHADDIVFSLKPTLYSEDCLPPERGVEGVEQAMIRRALAENGGHRQRAADSLGISKATLCRRIRSYGLAISLEPQRRSA